MRHRVIAGTFGRNPSHRNMLFKQLVTSLIEHGRITTTLHRAKAVRPLVDKVIGYAKEGDLNAKRSARKVINTKEAFKRLFGDVRNDYMALTKHKGGYSRIIKWKRRKGDNAPMVLMELLNYKPKEIKAKLDDAQAKGKKKITNTVPEKEEKKERSK